jgi:hypothetical protein
MLAGDDPGGFLPGYLAVTMSLSQPPSPSVSVSRILNPWRALLVSMILSYSTGSMSTATLCVCQSLVESKSNAQNDLLRGRGHVNIPGIGAEILCSEIGRQLRSRDPLYSSILHAC